jgi:putative copper export protein
MESFVVPSAWEVAGLLCKLFLYFGAATLAGAALNLAFYSDGSRRTVQGLLVYGLIGAVLGFQAVLLNYLVQVGMISASGLAGMFDWTMAEILMDTPLGETTLWRLVAFTVALVGLVICLQLLARRSQPPSRRLHTALVAIPALALLILAESFQLSGHVSVHGKLAQLAISLHVIAFAAWIGSLYPLLRLSHGLQASELAWFMGRFGDHARLVLALLLLAGLFLLWELLMTPGELWQTPYGLSLSLKLLLVAALLGLAAHNRYQLVPAVAEDKGGALLQLRRSIKGEMGLALLILLLTAYLSTLVGPMDHQAAAVRLETAESSLAQR